MCLLFSLYSVSLQRLYATPLENITLPQTTKFAVGKGMTAYAIKTEIPAFTVTAQIGFGNLFETKHTAGISSLLIKTIAIGGSAKFPGTAIYYTIERAGGNIHFDSGWEESSITITMLDRDAEIALEVLSDILVHPLLTVNALADARSLLNESLKRQRDEPHLIAFEVVRKILFDGDGYGAIPTEKTLNSITIEHLESAHKKYFTTGNIILGISSSRAREQIIQLCQKYFSHVPYGVRQSYTCNSSLLREKLHNNENKIFLIPREIPQATIAVGTIAPPIGVAEEIPLIAMNYILGGASFNSRLMNEIRAKRGLSYSTASVIRFRKHTGLFLAYAQTRTDEALLTLKLMEENIHAMKSNPITDDEMKWMKLSLENSYIFEFDTPKNILSKYLFLDYYNLNESYLTSYIEKIRSLTANTIMTAAKNLFSHGLIKVVVGKKELGQPLAECGEVIISKHP
ncbi:MAG: insulinase family protein [Spirochaetes bacterium]|nr:insulinase family protein [Spirochaetota bacterium]